MNCEKAREDEETTFVKKRVFAYDDIEDGLTEFLDKNNLPSDLQEKFKDMLRGYDIPPEVLILAKSIYEVADVGDLTLKKSSTLKGLNGVYAKVNYTKDSRIAIYNGEILRGNKAPSERSLEISFDIDTWADSYPPEATEVYEDLKKDEKRYNLLKSVDYNFVVDAYKMVAGQFNHAWNLPVLYNCVPTYV